MDVWLVLAGQWRGLVDVWGWLWAAFDYLVNLLFYSPQAIYIWAGVAIVVSVYMFARNR